MAESSAPKETTLRLMTQAELLLDEQRSEEALKILAVVARDGERQHNAALRLELKAQQLGGIGRRCWICSGNWSSGMRSTRT